MELAGDFPAPFAWDSPLAGAFERPLRLAFRAVDDPLEVCEKPFVLDDPSGRMVARRLRLRDGGRPAVRLGRLRISRDTASNVRNSLDEAPVLAVDEIEPSGLLEWVRRRRRVSARAREPEGGWEGAVTDGEYGEDSELPAELAAGTTGKGRSGWSEVEC